MKRLIPILFAITSACSVQPAHAITATKLAAITTIGINVIEAPATIRKAKAALKKIRHPKKRAM